jgi:hypothetical protein
MLAQSGGGVVLQRMLVTDVARMATGVCIAGYSVDLSIPIRPVLSAGGGIPWNLPVDHKGHVIQPFSVINVDLDQPRPDPPHTEDWVLSEPPVFAFEGRASERLVSRALAKLATDTIVDAFDGSVENRKFVQPGYGRRSLATIRIREMRFIDLGVWEDSGNAKYRVTFRDARGEQYNLPVSDAGFRAYVDMRVGERHEPRDRVARVIRARINSANDIYLRVGLSRPYSSGPSVPERCYLMLTGIYSIPDYRTVDWESLFPAPSERASIRT